MLKKPIIIKALPDKVNSKNFMAEYSFLPVPHIEIKKNIGIISSSKKKKNNIKSNDKNTPNTPVINKNNQK